MRSPLPPAPGCGCRRDHRGGPIHGGLRDRGDLDQQHVLPRRRLPRARAQRRRSADTLLRIEGGGVAKACGASTTCAQVFAAMGYDGWALNAADVASGPEHLLTNVMAAGGSKPVASNYDTTYTSKYADLGGAVLLAVSATSTATYRKASRSPWPRRATPASTSTYAGHPLRERHLERRHHATSARAAPRTPCRSSPRKTRRSTS